MVIELEPGNTCDAAAIPTLITRSHWRPRFQKTEPPVMRLRRGALLRSFSIVSTRCPALSVIFTVQPKSLARMRREPEAIRTNLQLVLYGSPTDRRLFP